MSRQLTALFCFCVIDTLGFGILIPLVPYMADRFGVAPQFITPVLGSYSLCQLLAAPWWGRLSDRFGRRPVLMTSLAGACVSYVLLGLAHSIWWLLASKQSRGQDRGAVMGAYVASASLARVLGPLSSGLLYAALGPAAPFLIGACVTLPAAYLVRRAAALR